MKPEGIAAVTGAARGLGRATALALARRGFEVWAAARDPAAAAGLEREARARGGALRVVRLDVTAPGDFAFPEGLRVLVNNAGVEDAYTSLEHSSAETWRRLFETNVFGLVELCRRAIPRLRESGGGVLCNVTSVSLLAPVPFYAAYRASKAAVSALSESLRAELLGFGVRVLEVMPGPIDTDMLSASQRPPEAAAGSPYAPLAERYLAARRAIDGSATPPARAAESIVDAILDDDAPLRVGCDPLAVGMLEGWRRASDEETMAGMLGVLATPAPREGDR